MSHLRGFLPFRARDGKATVPNGEVKELSRFFSLALSFLFALAALLSVWAALRTYGWVNQEQKRMDDTHYSMDLLVNTVRRIDTLDCLAIGSGPEGESLVLTEQLRNGVYETRIYLYQGAVVQEYAPSGMPYKPEDATKVVESTTFTFELSNGLLTIQTDSGTAEVALRSVRGGE